MDAENTQQEFDFDRSLQLALLQHAELTASDGGDGKRVSGGVQKEVLRVIDAHAGDSSTCWASVKAIAQQSCRGRRTVTRACRALRKRQLVIEYRQRCGTEWRYHRRVDWRRLAEFVDVDQLTIRQRDKLRSLMAGLREGATGTPSNEPVEGATVPVEGATVPVEGATVSISGCHQGYDKPSLNYPRNPPPPNTLSTPAGGWAAAAELLSQVGVEQVAMAIAAIRTADGTPAVIEAAVAYFDAHADSNGWGPGALCRWLTNWYPYQPADVGWPPPKPSAQHARRMAEEAAAKARADEERERTQHAKRVRRRDLEARYGAAADALSAEEFGQIMQGLSPYLYQRFKRSGRHSSPVRHAVLRELELRDETDPVEVSHEPAALE